MFSAGPVHVTVLPASAPQVMPGIVTVPPVSTPLQVAVTEVPVLAGFGENTQLAPVTAVSITYAVSVSVALLAALSSALITRSPEASILIVQST